MKKIYQSPQINKVLYIDSIMEGPTPASIGMSGSGDNSVNNGDGSNLDAGFGGDGTGPVDAKRHGGFWDDEE